MPLTPTLWRTCRVLANPCRLSCLRAVIDTPGRTVEEIAERAGLSAPVASLYLRHLQARGLVRPERVSRWVRYTAVADASVTHAGPTLAAVARALRAARRPYARLLQTLTAFTHPRRLAILRVIPDDGAASFSTIRSVTGISHSALCRHLAKLQRHGLTETVGDAWRIVRPLPALARVLLAETRQT